MIEGFFYLAKENKDLIIFSASPTYLLIKSDEETEKNVPSASVAHAFAKNVLPVPGGPYNKIPFHGFLLPVKISGNLIGRTTASFKEFLALTRPDTSSHFTLGFSVTIAWEICAFRPLLSLSPPPLPLWPPPPPLVYAKYKRPYFERVLCFTLYFWVFPWVIWAWLCKLLWPIRSIHWE